jgi:hypothetical protein
MSNAPQEYVTKPVLVEAWQLTEDNLPQVAKWCRGRVKGESITFAKIRDKSKVLGGQDNNHYAHIGDYIVRRAKGFELQRSATFEQGHQLYSRRQAAKEAS